MHFMLVALQRLALRIGPIESTALEPQDVEVRRRAVAGEAEDGALGRKLLERFVVAFQAARAGRFAHPTSSRGRLRLERSSKHQASNRKQTPSTKSECLKHRVSCFDHSRFWHLNLFVKWCL
jgi:hypothetical protein